MDQFAPRYRAARAFAGLTQGELADKLGLEVQTVKRREAGEKAPKKAELIALAAICEVPLEFLEHGWGHLTANEVTRLLRTQNQILEEIREATSDQRATARDLKEAMSRTADGLRARSLPPVSTATQPGDQQSPG